MSAPLYETTDYRRIILERLEVRGHTRKDLARGLDRSPSWISMALSGQRPLDPGLVEELGLFLGYDSRETAYLAALVDLDSTSPRARRLAWATVQATQAHRRSVLGISEDVARVHAHWYYPAIVELARCQGWRPEPRWIAGTLVPRVTESQAAEALTTLVRLGQLVPDDDLGLIAVDAPMWTESELPRGPTSQAVAEQHRAHCELAARGLFDFRFNERHFSTSTMALSEEHYPVLLARLREVEREMVMLALAGQQGANRVYQLGIQLLPVSDFSDSDEP